MTVPFAALTSERESVKSGVHVATSLNVGDFTAMFRAVHVPL
jgi:hypothetical protein